MITNSLYTNPYSKYSRDTLTKQVTYPKASVPKENRDIFVKQPVSNISFTGFFFNKGLFRKSRLTQEGRREVKTSTKIPRVVPQKGIDNPGRSKTGNCRI